MAENESPENEKLELLKYLIQFLNIEKRFPLLPGKEKLKSVADFIGIPEKTLKEIREEFDNNAKQAALELLKEKDIPDLIQALPFNENDVILAFGDSLTDDCQSWFEVLRHLLEIALPDRKLKFINSGISGDTSLDALKRLDRDVLSNEPDWVIVALGTNDALRMNYAANRPLVSLTEFWENINTIDLAVQDITENPVIWITPPPVITELMDEAPDNNAILYEKDLIQYRQVVAGKQGYIIDPLGQRMGQPAQAWNFLSDGLHPSLAGHVSTVKSFLKGMTNKESHNHEHHHHDGNDHHKH